MDEGIDAVEDVRVGVGGVPDAVVEATGTLSEQSDDVIALFAELFAEGLADEPGGAGDGYRVDFGGAAGNRAASDCGGGGVNGCVCGLHASKATRNMRGWREVFGIRCALTHLPHCRSLTSKSGGAITFLDRYEKCRRD